MATKAFNFDEIDQAIQFNASISANHPFFTDFNEVRGNFSQQQIFRSLNVKTTNNTYKYDPQGNEQNKTLLFLGGMRGSGKTCELNKYSSLLNTPDCFFCVTCNLDEGLDMNDIEYTDILIFQLERLTEKLSKEGVTLINEKVLSSMYKWFQDRIEENIDSSLYSTEIEAGVEIKTPPILSSLLSLFTKVKANIKGSDENRIVTRRSLKNRFDDLAIKFNEFIGYANEAIKKQNKGKEILFIIDGLEKTYSTETRRKIIISEHVRMQKIKVNSIFTLPIELMKERQNLTMFSIVKSFPFVRIINKDDSQNTLAVDRFKDFIYKRIDKSLFEGEAVVEKAIKFSGGSPRELLRIITYTFYAADENKGLLDMKSLDEGLEQLSDEQSRYLEAEELKKLKELKDNNIAQKLTPYDSTIEELLSKLIIMEYNSGSFMRVNPIIEISPIYIQNVL